MTGHIYLIRNTVNGKGYVGQTVKTVVGRFGQHKTDARNGRDSMLWRAIRKYGEDNFKVQAVASCEAGELLNELERHYIKFFGTFQSTGHGYNATLGGEGISGYKRSQESIDRIKASRVGYRSTEETRSRVSASLMGNKRSVGRKHSLATKVKMSLSRTGLPSANKGRPWSEARRAAHLKQFEGVIQ